MIGTCVKWPYERMQGTSGLEEVGDRKLKLVIQCSQILIGGVLADECLLGINDLLLNEGLMVDLSGFQTFLVNSS